MGVATCGTRTHLDGRLGQLDGLPLLAGQLVPNVPSPSLMVSDPSASWLGHEAGRAYKARFSSIFFLISSGRSLSVFRKRTGGR